MSAANQVLTELEARDGHPRGVKPDDWMARCPAHEDRTPSLSITRVEGKVLLRCFAGCTVEEVLAALGLEKQHLFDDFYDDSAKGSSQSVDGMPDWYGEPIVKVYDYHDENGRVLYRVGRTPSKQFPVYHPNGNGGWKPGLNGTRRVLYRLPEVLAAVERGDHVFLTEGEKDADSLKAAGVTATTNPGGAKKCKPDYLAPLRGATVIVVPDRDEPGKAHAAQVVEALQGIASTVEVREPVEGKDVSDHLAAGKSVDELVPLNGDAPPAESMDTAELLTAVKDYVTGYVVLSPTQAIAVTLWVLHSHAFEAAEATPYLSISSAEKESGKTRLLEAVEFLVRDVRRTANVTPAYLFRLIEERKPTLLFDEIDAVFGPKAKDNEDLRGIINDGYRRGGTAGRCGGKNNTELQEFKVFCPKALAGLGKLPHTIASRAIHLRLKRRKSNEPVKRFYEREARAAAAPIHEALVAWAASQTESLARARPALSDALGDRACDVWEPLFAIADLAGGEWPDVARRAACELSGDGDTEDGSAGVLLLADIRKVFTERETDRLPTKILLTALHELEESPWGDWFGKPISARRLAKMLDDYGIAPHSDGEVRGYKREAFEDAWTRYLPSEPSKRQEPASQSGKQPISTRQDEAAPDTLESGAMPLLEPDSDGLTDGNPEQGWAA